MPSAKKIAASTATVSEEGLKGTGPFPSFPHPSEHDCRRACSALAELHEDVTNERLRNNGTLLEAGCHRVTQASVLDSLVRTILRCSPAQLLSKPCWKCILLPAYILTQSARSQNTTDSTSARAFASLKSSFPSWEEVMKADSKLVEDAIRVGGLAEIKVARIKAILERLVEERGVPPSLEHLRGMGDEEAKAELTRFKGVGPKTAACVLMFCLDRNEFPVDTHVWHIAQRLGWVPPKADREQTYEHLNIKVPDDIKFDLHVLLVEHGKRCVKCAKGGRLLKPEAGPCPLVRVGATSPPSSLTAHTVVKSEGWSGVGTQGEDEKYTTESLAKGWQEVGCGRTWKPAGGLDRVCVKVEEKQEIELEDGTKKKSRKIAAGGGVGSMKQEIDRDVKQEASNTKKSRKGAAGEGSVGSFKQEIKRGAKERAGVNRTSQQAALGKGAGGQNGVGGKRKRVI